MVPPPGSFEYAGPFPKLPHLEHLPATLRPAESAIGPPGHSYPQSPPLWTLVSDPPFYKVGKYYLAEASSNRLDIQREKDRMMSLRMPPNVAPTWDEEAHKFVAEPIPGMVEMPVGVPFAVRVDGKPNQILTVGCAHTLDTLKDLPEGPEIIEITRSLEDELWGSPPSDDKPAVRPLYTWHGLGRNDRDPNSKEKDRSTKPSDEPPSYIGSFNLAGTVEQGHGAGKVVPAVQISYAEGREQITRVLGLLNRFYRLVMPYCISKMEMELMDFHSQDNNIFTFGGVPPCGTGVQMNVSTSFNGEDLIKMIGSTQGSWHPDSSDDETRPTLFLLFLRLPEGKVQCWTMI